jgi:transposase InsO family protein/transposase-like protein
MPFREQSCLEQRISILAEYDAGGVSVTALCEAYGISRQTFYEWRDRRSTGQADWFVDRSHAPKTHPRQTSQATAEAVIAARRRFPQFGPKKLKAWLAQTQPGQPWPAASIMGDILKREGLVEPRGRRRRARELGRRDVVADEPNAEWACDFKGWFRTLDGQRCDPLTITDTASRYLIDVRITAQTTAAVRTAFERAFADHGLPQAIRSDNGSPFGANSAAGLTGLSVWWLKLGIRPHPIRPASPQDNGRHERMHRTLKDHTTRPPARSLAEQQHRFDDFRQHYNHERPHEALDQRPPASLWTPSPRPMPRTLLEPWCDADHQVRRVRTSGEIRWNNQLVFITEPLVGETVGITQREDGKHLVRYFDIDLGLIDPSGRFLRFAPLRHRLRYAQEDQHP